MSKIYVLYIGMVMENGKCCFYVLFILLRWKVFSNEKLFLFNFVVKFFICKFVNEKVLLIYVVKILIFY